MDAIVVIAASAGGLKPLQDIVGSLPWPCTATVFVVVHIGHYPSVLPSLLARPGRLPASFGRNDELIEQGHIYVAPPDHHMVLDRSRIWLNQGAKVHHTRPAADPLFISAAEAYGEQVIGVVLSGGDGDGAIGLRIIKEHGGTTLVQHPDEAEKPSMPNSAVGADHPDLVLPIRDIARLVSLFCSGSEHPPGQTSLERNPG